MFGIDFPELLVIALVALVVLGPERLPKVARFAGLWVRRARNQWDSVKSELERELAADELKRNLHDAQEALRRTEQNVRRGGQDAQREFDDIRDAVKDTSTTPKSSDDTAADVAATAVPEPAASSAQHPAAEASPAEAARKDPGDEQPRA